MSAWPLAAQAQVPLTLPTPAEPRLPEPAPPLPQPAPDLEIGPPERERPPSPADELRFAVRDIVIEGASVFDAATLRRFAEPVIGQQASVGEIIAVADRITAHYRGEGYVLSRAVLPPQRIRDGVVTIRVIEGYVSRVLVEGVDGALRERIVERLQPATAERPVTLATLERALLLARDLPGVDVQGTLRPAAEFGAAELVVSASVSYLQGVVGVSNRGSPYAGPWSTSGEVSFNSALGRGERLTVGLTLTPDMHEQRLVHARYVEPVGGDGLTLGVEGYYSTGEPGRTLRPFDVQSQSWRVGGRASYPLIRGRRENLILDGGIAWQDTDVDVQHSRFTRDSYSLADVRLTYVEAGSVLGGSTSLSGGVTQGLGVGGSDDGDAFLSRADAEPDFTKLTGEVRRLQPLWDKLAAHALIVGQYSFDPLFSSEEFVLGGGRVGRGYDPAEITGWHGLGAALELRYGEAALDGWQGYAFYDRGRVWRDTQGVEENAQLESAGAGVRFKLGEGIAGTLELAHPLGRPPATADGDRPWKLYLDLSYAF